MKIDFDSEDGKSEDDGVLIAAMAIVVVAVLLIMGVISWLI